jgi:tRNA-dihydrouridine synthase A
MRRTTALAPTAASKSASSLFSTSESSATNNGSSSGTIPASPLTKEQKYEQLMSSSKLSLAPMMEYTDRHFRKLVSLISTNTLCYTEMVAANALVHERLGSRKKALGDDGPDANTDNGDDTDSKPNANTGVHAYEVDLFKDEKESQLDIEQYGYDMRYIRRFLGQYSSDTPDPIKRHNPTVLQLGGSDPDMLQEATSIVTEVTNRGYCDYTAINLNCGCPSPKVAGKGNFGASLMNDPKLVRDIVTAMDKGTDSNTPITVKCRIGTDETLIQNGLKFTSQNYATIDEEEEYKQLCNFIDTVASSGVVTDFQIHARIAVLQRNFSPTDNRKIPTLKYHYIRKLVEEFPELKFSLNGGVDTLPHVKEELDMCPGMNGVMVGRALAANPWSFSMADELLYNQSDNDNKIWKPKNRLEVLQEYGKYADQEEQNWDPVKIRRFIIKAITPLFAGEPNGKRYRIAVDEIAGLPKKRAIQLNNNQKISDSRMDVPVSELIMNAALEHLSEDVLLRTPEESYERLISSSNKSFGGAASVVPRSDIIKDWQNDRKVQEQEEQTV